MSTVPGCGAHCTDCSLVDDGNSVKCSKCEDKYALNDDTNTACERKTARRLPFHTFFRFCVSVFTTTATATTNTTIVD